MARINLQKLEVFLTLPEKRCAISLLAATGFFGAIFFVASMYSQQSATIAPTGSNRWPLSDHGRTIYITGVQNGILSVVIPLWIFAMLAFFFCVFFVLMPRLDKRLKAANKNVKDISGD